MTTTRRQPKPYAKAVRLVRAAGFQEKATAMLHRWGYCGPPAAALYWYHPFERQCDHFE